MHLALRENRQFTAEQAADWAEYIHFPSHSLDSQSVRFDSSSADHFLVVL